MDRIVEQADTEVQMTEIVLPQHTNAMGTAFGGQVMSWIDICAAISAQRFCRTPVVTASIDAVNFLTPVVQGNILVFQGRVNAAFTTSMECGVTVFKEDPLTGERTLAVQAYATFVAVDDAGKKIPVPKFKVFPIAEAIEEEEEAKNRREQRLLLRQRRAAKRRK